MLDEPPVLTAEAAPAAAHDPAARSGRRPHTAWVDQALAGGPDFVGCVGDIAR